MEEKARKSADTRDKSREKDFRRMGQQKRHSGPRASDQENKPIGIPSSDIMRTWDIQQ